MGAAYNGNMHKARSFWRRVARVDKERTDKLRSTHMLFESSDLYQLSGIGETDSDGVKQQKLRRWLATQMVATQAHLTEHFYRELFRGFWRVCARPLELLNNAG